MKSPYARLRELCGITQADFRRKYDFSKMTLIYVEAGLYPEVSDRLNEALALECQTKGVDGFAVLRDEYRSKGLTDAYQKWQRGERSRFADKLAEPSSDWSDEVSPFYLFAVQSGGSVQGFCKGLKVPAASVLRYETGATLTMPKSIEAALREVGYPHLDALIAQQNAWLAHKAGILTAA